VLGSPVLGSLGLRQNALHAFDDNNEHNDAAGLQAMRMLLLMPQ